MIEFTQRSTNNRIINEIRKAQKFIIIHTMFFDLDDIIRELNKRANEIDIKIFIGINPFIKTNRSLFHSKIKIEYIEMRTMLMYVYHVRLFHTDKVFSIGGIDFTSKNLSDNYNQYTLFLPNESNIYQRINYNKNESFEIQLFNEPLYGCNYIYNNASDKLLSCISKAQKHIFFDQQYFADNSIFDAIINKKKKNPDIQIDVYTNNNFDLNPIKVVDTKFSINPYKIKLNNNYKKLIANNINIHYFNDKYTHNKITIFDKKDILFGSMNIADRSLKKDKDTELCIYIENNHELCFKILNKY